MNWPLNSYGVFTFTTLCTNKAQSIDPSVQLVLLQLELLNPNTIQEQASFIPTQ